MLHEPRAILTPSSNLFLKIANQLIIKSPFSSELVGFGTPHIETQTLSSELIQNRNVKQLLASLSIYYDPDNDNKNNFLSFFVIFFFFFLIYLFLLVLYGNVNK